MVTIGYCCVQRLCTLTESGCMELQTQIYIAMHPHVYQVSLYYRFETLCAQNLPGILGHTRSAVHSLAHASSTYWTKEINSIKFTINWHSRFFRSLTALLTHRRTDARTPARTSWYASARTKWSIICISRWKEKQLQLILISAILLKITEGWELVRDTESKTLSLQQRNSTCELNHWTRQY